MADTRFNLNLIDVPNPCAVPWESMTGGETVRHCGQCRQSVYHLSKMSRAEAEALLCATKGQVCVQFYRRADGTVVTRECAALRWWRGLTSAVTLAVMGVLTFLGITRVFESSNPNSTFSFVGGGSIRPPTGSYDSRSGGSTPPAPTAPHPHEPGATAKP